MLKGLNKIMDTLDSKDWFQKILDEIFKQEKQEKKPFNRFFPSSAGQCPRSVQYNMMGLMPDDIDDQSRRRMDNGNYMHLRYGAYFKSVNKLIEEEPAFRMDMDGVFVSGRGDLIVADSLGNKTLIELKSINDRKFKLILKKPDFCHYLQWNICSKALNYPTGIILYENKNTQEIKYHHVNFSEEDYRKVINEWLLIDKHLKEGTLIPRPEKCPNYWCSMKNECK
jgi:hypothetical protein